MTLCPLLLYTLELNFFYFTLVYQIIKEVVDFIKVKGSAYEDIKDKVEFRHTPPYFKLGKLILHDKEKQEIHIRIDENMPMANCGDRISVNQKLHVSLVTCLVFIQQVFKPLYCSLFTTYLIKNCEFTKIAGKLIISKRTH